MKSKIFIFLSFFLIGFSSCNLFQNKSSNQEWVGVYRGVLPCADCAGILTQLELRADNQYILTQKYLGKNDTIFKHREDFELDKNSKIISLKNNRNSNASYKYIFEENKLSKLDSRGNRIQSEFEDLYSLYSIEKDRKLKNKHWKLVELNGKEIPKKLKYKIPTHIVFKENTIIGNAGCNKINGKYKIEENRKIELLDIASTKMYCEFMDFETQFLEFMQNTDSFELITDTLVLHTKKQKTAKFKYLFFK